MKVAQTDHYTINAGRARVMVDVTVNPDMNKEIQRVTVNDKTLSYWELLALLKVLRNYMGDLNQYGKDE